ncbi:MAG: PrsW family intramembrane metalloprotease [Bacteroidales bacterium]|nr:PrsW family intramembrane metalloprotease [Bacteroidales bacterium]
MNNLALIALLPVAVILYYVYKKDRDPEPIKTVAATFGLGALSCIPAILFELLAELALGFTPLETDTSLYHRAHMFWGVAAIEEICKWSVVMVYVWKHKDFDDSYDAIVYCVSASLGFAALENIMYVFQNGLGVALMRAITSVPGHACFGVFMGFFIAKAKYYYSHERIHLYRGHMILALTVPTLVHGEYDYLLTVGEMWYFLLLIVVADIVALLLIHHSFKADHPIVVRETPEPPPFITTPPPFDGNVASTSNIDTQCDTE